MVIQASANTGQFVTIFMLAIALGMDAFSLGIGLGMKRIHMMDILLLGTLTALFHVMMPMLGMLTGHYFSSLLGEMATALGGSLLIVLGAQMIYQSFHAQSTRSLGQTGLWGMLIFALSVSIDSFSVGISFGLFASNLLLTVMMFGLFGGIMTILGLMLGRRLRNWVGEFGEAFGGLILLLFGVKFLL